MGPLLIADNHAAEPERGCAALQRTEGQRNVSGQVRYSSRAPRSGLAPTRDRDERIANTASLASYPGAIRGVLLLAPPAAVAFRRR